jgi:hypothetical protein
MPAEDTGDYLGHAGKIFLWCINDKYQKVSSIIVMILRQVQFQFFL